MPPGLQEHVEIGQPFHLELLHRLAVAVGDPDSDYPLTLKQGVPLGVTDPTLRSPGIWPTKEELAGEDLESPDFPDLQGRDNYPSAKDFTQEILKTFEEEKALDMVSGPHTAQEAANLCGCAPADLCPGPMAAIDEGDKVRTIYDGSWGGANAHIQNHTVERTTAPTVLDCVQCIQWLQSWDHCGVPSASGGETPQWSPPSSGEDLMLLKADVSKAHRRVKVLPQDWRYQVAQIQEQWWINKVGTYGMASAQLYWGRLAALLLRLLYHLVPAVDWGYVFVDDLLLDPAL
eukprot:Skav232210  [mRNA]  locus=scaffold2626:349848:350714:+ [translate_table: standard]